MIQTEKRMLFQHTIEITTIRKVDVHGDDIRTSCKPFNGQSMQPSKERNEHWYIALNIFYRHTKDMFNEEAVAEPLTLQKRDM